MNITFSKNADGTYINDMQDVVHTDWCVLGNFKRIDGKGYFFCMKTVADQGLMYQGANNMAQIEWYYSRMKSAISEADAIKKGFLKP